jgi:hypothetical protein
VAAVAAGAAGADGVEGVVMSQVLKLGEV